VLLARKKYERAVALMKGVVERELTKEEREDADTFGAYSRIEERLKKLLKEQPQLAAIEKSALNKKSAPLTEQTSFDIELLTGARP